MHTITGTCVRTSMRVSLRTHIHIRIACVYATEIWKVTARCACRKVGASGPGRERPEGAQQGGRGRDDGGVAAARLDGYCCYYYYYYYY